MSCFYDLHLKVEAFFGGAFEKYGKFVARHPWKAIIFVVIVDIGFGIGLINLTQDTSLEQYAPTDSTSMKQRELVKSMFTVDTSTNYYAQSLVNLGSSAVVIIQKKNGGNMIDSAIWSDLTTLRDYVIDTTISSSGTSYNFTHLCAKRFSSCVIDGNYILDSDFTTALAGGTVSYPQFTTSGETFTIDNTFAETGSSGGYLTSATAVKLKFNLANTNSKLADAWEDAFLDRIKTYSSSNLNFEFAHSRSTDEELNANVAGDIAFFSITFTLMITFSGFVLFGGNCVSNRYNIAMAGVLSTGMAIVAALGFISAVGVLFASIVGTMPFLILGIGVDDMFILLSGLAATSPELDTETRIGLTMKSSGVAITITSLTDVIAFCAGASSVFPAVRNFSWFTGAAILFCYLNYITFYLGCMTINEDRIKQNRHYFTCQKIKSKDAMQKSGQSKADIFCCSGSPHKDRNEVEGPIEKYPKKFVTKVVLFTPAKIIILLLFAGFVAVSIYGAVHFEQDFNRKDLVTTDSYFYTYYDTETKLYDQSLIISLNVQAGIDYLSGTTLDMINSLRDNVRNDTDIDDTFFLSWLHAYIDSASYDDSSLSNFISGLQTFLGTTAGNLYINDVTIDDTSITASRFHVLTENLASSTQQGNMMTRIRDIVGSSSLPVFAYAPGFIFFEQYVVILSQTMQTLGICVAVVFIVITIFLPLPVMILLITITVVLIMTSVIGFMHLWGLTLSSITMIHIIMCIGFCVDFATHVCHAYVQAKGKTRNERVAIAIDHAGGPILNGALSTIIGVLMLAFSKSFIFFSFFKVMFMVMVFGLLYSVFLLPVVLSFIGPHYNHEMKIAKVKDDRALPEKSDETIT
ncbi:patched domain-containing protein 3-like [Mytilus californianus]|uniref:patched domain-containing protein 3-like n=1 Tax=Mytilus californianus TaxID=6549 RepID=UPI002245F210|nr:patched domain-containing protein 3-like [Mytilus californianus]